MSLIQIAKIEVKRHRVPHQRLRRQGKLKVGR